MNLRKIVEELTDKQYKEAINRVDASGTDTKEDLPRCECGNPTMEESKFCKECI